MAGLSKIDAKNLMTCAGLMAPVLGDSFTLTLKLCLGGLLPKVAIGTLTVTNIIVLFILGLLKVSVFTGMDGVLSAILLVAVILCIIFKLARVERPVFGFSKSGVFANNFGNFVLTTLLLVGSTGNCCGIL